MTEIERYQLLMQVSNAVLVFGSNLAGRHGKGAAREAAVSYGAVYGQAEGLQGRSYAIPTKDADLHTLPLNVILRYVKRFLMFAELAPNLQFVLTRVGCGLAGLTDNDMAPLFATAPPNVVLPSAWRTGTTDRSLPSNPDTKST